MQTVYLKGDMGNRFGEKWSMNVSNVPGIFKLIECQREGFRSYMIECMENGVDFTVQRGEEFVDETELLLSVGEEDITVTAIPAGSKGNVGKLIMAAALIYTGMYFLDVGAFAATGAGAAGSYTAVNAIGYTLITLGTSLGLRTLGEMMLPDTKTENEDDSHLFGGPVNATTQGGAVPILYGEMMVGGHTINSSFTSSMASSWGSGMPGRDNPLGIDIGAEDINVL